MKCPMGKLSSRHVHAPKIPDFWIRPRNFSKTVPIHMWTRELEMDLHSKRFVLAHLLLIKILATFFVYNVGNEGRKMFEVAHLLLSIFGKYGPALPLYDPIPDPDSP